METQQTLCVEIIGSVSSCGPAFGQLINETVDNVLSSLGTRCKRAIYDYVEKKFDLRERDIADNASEFSEALEQIFGGAAALIEMQIMKELYRKVPQFKHRPPKGKLTFPDYVNALNRFIRDTTEAPATFFLRTKRKNKMANSVLRANVEKLL